MLAFDLERLLDDLEDAAEGTSLSAACRRRSANGRQTGIRPGLDL
ncbi:hypothetical protein [Nannocystis sp. SCPEA4]|nr:hypothetical protein [Nannocystis sp. SCPEA4]MCY1060794.1 hypothetical protein [Nannocystis sp. SCPEA4]